MEDYNRVLEATSVAENANGVAAEKMTVYNESLEAAQNRLTASVQQFAQDSNLDRTLALAYDGLSKVVEILNILLNKIPVLSPLIKAMGVALATAFAANVIAKMFSTSSAFKSIISIAPTVVKSFVNIATGATTLGAAITAAGGPVTVILSALSAIIAIAPAVAAAWQKIFPSAEKKAEEAKSALDESNSELEETKTKIEDVQKQIDEINSKDKLTLADEAERDRLQEQLDLLEKIEDNQEKINEEKKATALETEQEKVNQMTGYDASVVSQTRSSLKGTKSGNYNAVLEKGNVNALIGAYQELDKAKKQLNASDKDYAEQVKENENLSSQFSTKLLEQKQAALEEMQALANLGDTTSEQYQKLQALVDQINITLDPSSWGKIEIGQLIDDSGYDGVLSNLHDRAVSAVQKAGEDSSQEAQTQAQQAMSQLDGYITTEANKIAEKIANDKDLKKQFTEWLNINPKDVDQDKIFEVIKQQLQQAYGVATDAANTATAANKEYNASLTSTSELADMLGQSEVDLANETKSLSDAYNAMIKNGKITKTQMVALIKQYPELTDAIEVQNGVIRINTEVLQEKYQQVIKTHDQVIQDQIDETNKVIEQTKERIKAYQAEITALQTVQLSRNVFVDEAIDPETGASVSGRSQSVEGKGGNRFGSKSSIQSAIDAANKQLEKYQKNLEVLMASLHTGDKLTYTGSSKSGSSAADKAQKEAEKKVKQQIKNLKGIVTLYSQEEDWMSPEIIKKYTDEYNDALSEIVNNPEARKIAATSLGIDIDGKSAEQQIKDVTAALQKSAGTIDEANQKLAKSALTEMNKVHKAAEQEYEDAVKNIESLQKMTVNMIETAIDLFQKAGDIVFSLIGNLSKKYDKQIDALDAQMDNLDKIADNLDDQKDAFDDKIDAQKEMLKLQKEEMDNADELAEKNKSIADIDAQLMELQYDDSAKAQAKRLKLLDERAQKEKDLSDYQKGQAYDTKVNALDREKDAYDKNIEAQKKYIEAQKEALKEQQDAIKATQDKFEQNLSKAQNVFNGFIKVISSDIFKNLAANLLDSLDGQTLYKVLDAWNTWFGDGLKTTAKNTWDKAYASADWLGWKKGSSISDILNIGKQGQQNEKDIQTIISNALTKNESGVIDFSSIKNNVDSMSKSFADFSKNALQSITKVDTKTSGVVQNVLNLGKQALNAAANSSNGVISTLAKGIQKITGASNAGIISVGNSGNGVIAQLSQNGINSILQMGTTGQGVLGNLGNIAGGILNQLAQGGLQILNSLGGIAGKVVSGIGGIIGKVGSALGIGSAGTAAAGVAGAGGLAGVGGALASVASTAGTLALPVAAIGTGIVGGIQSFKNIRNVWQDENASVLKKVATTAWNISPIGIVGNAIGSVIKGVGKFFGFHHSGSDYVKKEHPELDRMLGLKDDETVSVLKVGEAVVPTWANSASSSASNNRFTGSPFGSAVDSAVKSARASMGNSNVSNTTDSSINISMPINIKGDADENTVRALKDATNNIVNTVLRTINTQTRMGGYRNIKAATI